MKTSLLISTFLLLPGFALAQNIAPEAEPPQPPVPEVGTDMVAPPAPETPEFTTAPQTSAAGDASTSAPDDTATSAPVAEAAVDDPAVQEQPILEEPAAPADIQSMARGAFEEAKTFLQDGGPSIWAIAALSVVTLALILWKIWRLALIGAWSKGKARQAILAYEAGDADRALALVHGRRGVRSKVVAAALGALKSMPEAHAREETARVAKRELGSARSGLGALELISTIAPLLGLLGTVMGMIAAFQALQAAGSKADPAMLAGGIWEALLTTAAGMAVAIPASAALTWFEAVIDRIRRDVEDGATRLFVSEQPNKIRLAAE